MLRINARINVENWRLKSAAKLRKTKLYHISFIETKAQRLNGVTSEPRNGKNSERCCLKKIKKNKN